MKYTKEYIQKVRLCSNLIEPPASDVIGGLLDEIERLQSENEWHKYPDEKPQKTGEYLIVYDDHIYRAKWKNDLWTEIEDSAYYGYQLSGLPTHYRPLPQPPESEG